MFLESSNELVREEGVGIFNGELLVGEECIKGVVVKFIVDRCFLFGCLGGWRFLLFVLLLFECDLFEFICCFLDVEMEIYSEVVFRLSVVIKINVDVIILVSYNRCK